MKNITNLEVLYLAYYQLLFNLEKEEIHAAQFLKENGRENEISNHRISKIKLQADELHHEILNIEKAN